MMVFSVSAKRDAGIHLCFAFSSYVFYAADLYMLRMIAIYTTCKSYTINE